MTRFSSVGAIDGAAVGGGTEGAAWSVQLKLRTAVVGNNHGDFHRSKLRYVFITMAITMAIYIDL